MEWGKYIFFGLATLFVVAVYQSGFEKVKDSPVDEGVQAAGTIYEWLEDKLKDGGGKDNETTDDTESGKQVIGKPNCEEDDDCRSLDECSSEGCICDVSTGECYKEV